MASKKIRLNETCFETPEDSAKFQRNLPEKQSTSRRSLNPGRRLYNKNIASEAQILQRSRRRITKLRSEIDFSLSDVKECLEYLKNKLKGRTPAIVLLYPPQSDASTNSVVPVTLKDNMRAISRLETSDVSSSHPFQDVKFSPKLKRKDSRNNYLDSSSEGATFSSPYEHIKRDYGQPQIISSQDESSKDICDEQTSENETQSNTDFEDSCNAKNVHMLTNECEQPLAAYSQDMNNVNNHEQNDECEKLPATNASEEMSPDRISGELNNNEESYVSEVVSQELKGTAMQSESGDEVRKNRDVSSPEIPSQNRINKKTPCELGIDYKSENFVNMDEQRKSLEKVCDSTYSASTSQGWEISKTSERGDYENVSSTVCLQEEKTAGTLHQDSFQNNFSDSPDTILKNHNDSKEQKSTPSRKYSPKSCAEHRDGIIVLGSNNYFQDRSEIISEDKNKICYEELKEDSPSRSSYEHFCEDDENGEVDARNLKYISDKSYHKMTSEDVSTVKDLSEEKLKDSGEESSNNLSEDTGVSNIVKQSSSDVSCSMLPLTDICKIKSTLEFSDNSNKEKHVNSLESECDSSLNHEKPDDYFTDNNSKTPNEPQDSIFAALRKRTCTLFSENLLENNSDTDNASLSNGYECSFLVTSYYSPGTDSCLEIDEVTYSEETNITPVLEDCAANICSEQYGYVEMEDSAAKPECMNFANVSGENSQCELPEVNRSKIFKDMSIEDSKTSTTPVLQKPCAMDIADEQNSCTVEEEFVTIPTESVRVRDNLQEKAKYDSPEENRSEFSKINNSTEEKTIATPPLQEHRSIGICNEQHSDTIKKDIADNPLESIEVKDISSENTENNCLAKNPSELKNELVSTVEQETITNPQFPEHSAMEMGSEQHSYSEKEDYAANLSGDDCDLLEKSSSKLSKPVSTVDEKAHINPLLQKDCSSEICFEQRGSSISGFLASEYLEVGDDSERAPTWDSSNKDPSELTEAVNTTDETARITLSLQEDCASDISSIEYGYTVKKYCIQDPIECVEISDTSEEELKIKFFEETHSEFCEDLSTVEKETNFTSPLQNACTWDVCFEQHSCNVNKDIAEDFPESIDSGHRTGEELKSELPIKNSLGSSKAIHNEDEQANFTSLDKGNCGTDFYIDHHVYTVNTNSSVDSSEPTEMTQADIAEENQESDSSEEKPELSEAMSTAEQKTSVNPHLQEHCPTDTFSEQQGCSDKEAYALHHSKSRTDKGIPEEETESDLSEEYHSEFSKDMSTGDEKMDVTVKDQDHFATDICFEQHDSSIQKELVESEYEVSKKISEMVSKFDSSEKNRSEFSTEISTTNVSQEQEKTLVQDATEIPQDNVMHIHLENKGKGEVFEKNYPESPSQDREVSNVSREDLRAILNSVYLEKTQSLPQNSRKRKNSSSDTHYSSESSVSLVQPSDPPVSGCFDSIGNVNDFENPSETNQYADMDNSFVQKKYFLSKYNLTYKRPSLDKQESVCHNSRSSVNEHISVEFPVYSDKPISEMGENEDINIISNKPKSKQNATNIDENKSVVAPLCNDKSVMETEESGYIIFTSKKLSSNSNTINIQECKSVEFPLHNDKSETAIEEDDNSVISNEPKTKKTSARIQKYKSVEFTAYDDKSETETEEDENSFFSNKPKTKENANRNKRKFSQEEYFQKRPRPSDCENRFPTADTINSQQRESSSIAKEINQDIPEFTPASSFAIYSPSSTEKSFSSVSQSTFQKYVSSDDLIFRLLEWDVNWLRIQLETNCIPPIIDECKEVKNCYRSVEEYYDTYFPFFLLNIWLSMFSSWKVSLNENCLDAKFEHLVENKCYVRITCSSIMTNSEFKDFPTPGGVIIVTFTKGDGSLEKSFGYIDNVMEQPYDPLAGIVSVRNMSWQKVIFSICIAEQIKEPIQEFIKIQKILNIKNLLIQNDALQCLENSAMKDIILNPEINKSNIKVISCSSSSTFQKLNEKVQKILSCIAFESNQIILVHTSPSDRVYVVFKIVKAMMKRHCSVILCFKDEKKCLMMATYLAEFGLILAVRESDVTIPDYLKRFLLDEQIEEKTYSGCSRESIRYGVLRDCNIILTISSCMNLKDVAGSFFDGNSVCILDEANVWNETETMVLLSYNIRKMVLISNSNKEADVHPFLKKYGYNRSLYSRLYKIKCTV